MKRSTRPRKTANLSKSVSHQLNMYALAGECGRSGLAGASEVRRGEGGLHARQGKAPGKRTFYLIDLTHNGNANFILNGSRYSSIDRSASSRAVFPGTNYPDGAAQIGGAYPFASALKAGTKIGPGGPFAANANFMGVVVEVLSQKSVFFSGKWVNGEQGVTDRYLGLKFTIHNQDHFGWARLTTKIHDPKIPLMTTTLTGYA